MVTANLPRALDTTLRRRGTGGVIEVRAGVWRIDVEAPRDPATGRRRRRSRLIRGTREDAERALGEYGPALSSGTLESARADELCECETPSWVGLHDDEATPAQPRADHLPARGRREAVKARTSRKRAAPREPLD
jgi:hypothetical protein